MVAQDRTRREERRDKIITLVLAGLMLAMFAVEAHGSDWGDWKHVDEIAGNEKTGYFSGWQAGRFANPNSAVVSSLVTRPDGVHCYVSYWPSVGVDQYMSTAEPLQFVARYGGLPEAMQECREAINQQLGLVQR